NDDRALAASALVEGDATLLMYAYLAENLSPGALKDTVLGSLFQNIEELQNAPRILRESLLFPYMEGAKFCAVLQESGPGGSEASSAAYNRLPSSTAEIYHPYRYLQQWEPEHVTWPEPKLNGQ